MTPAQARALLEAWQGQDEGLKARVLAKLPAPTPHAARQAKDNLEAAGVMLRGGFLTWQGRALARKVGEAVHNGWALPNLDGEA